MRSGVTAGAVLAHGAGGSATTLPPWCAPVLLALAGLVAAVVLLRSRRPGPVRRAGVLTVGVPRVVRGLLVAATSIGMSLSGHVLAGVPPAITAELVAAVVVLAAGCCAASGIRWTGPRLLVATGTAEPAFHVLFEMSRADGNALPGAAAALAGLLTDPVMLAAHALAAVALAAVLAHGEALAFDVVALLAAAVARCVAPVVAGPVPRCPSGPRSSEVRALPRPSSVVLLTAPRRGPPEGVGVG